MPDSFWKHDKIGPEVVALHFEKKRAHQKEAMEEIFKELQEAIRRKKLKLSDLEIKIFDLEMGRKLNPPE